jgi:sulfite reductase (NADPH) flavoprotein alpha-component
MARTDMAATKLDIANEPRASGERATAADPWAAAPFDAATAAEARSLVAKLDARQRLWLGGYLAGSLEPASAATPAPSSTPPVAIVYGSQSGNAEQLAKRLAARLAEQRVHYRVLDMLDCRKKDLESAATLLVIVSTHGDGDPPDRALALHELLHSRKAPRLENARFAVLALGDSSYDKFCETGRQFDAGLEALGAKRLAARVDCDVDFEDAAQRWIETVVAAVAVSEPAPAHAHFASRPSSMATAYTRKNPFAAPVLANQRLTGRGSSKDVRHIELALDGSSIHYEPGDSLGIVPRNRTQEVDALLDALRLPAEAPVASEGQTLELRTALLERCEIGALSTAFVRRYAAAAASTDLARLAEHELKLARYVHGRDLLDLVMEHPPHGLDAAALVKLLRPLGQRLYSLASSLAATPDEAHLTVSLVEYEAHGRARRGVVSGILAELDDDAALPVYLHRNTAFRLPTDGDAPIVMIGAGTGVAPFRAFVAEREAAGARGRNWLVFGDRSFEHDFLYQAEWLGWRKNGLLARLDVAFSRDQEHKVYVQHRLLEHGALLWAWLQDNAHIYVCGDAQGMAPDVEAALLAVIREHGRLGDDDARELLLELTRARRYQRDVY